MSETAGGEQNGERLPSAAEVLVSTLHLLLTVGYERIGLRPGSTADLPEAERSIEGVRALLPVVEPLLPPDALREYRQALADLQMAYAEVVSAGGRTEPPPPSDVETPPRPKIWTPRGDV
jgi:hypothetical protein